MRERKAYKSQTIYGEPRVVHLRLTGSRIFRFSAWNLTATKAGECAEWRETIIERCRHSREKLLQCRRTPVDSQDIEVCGVLFGLATLVHMLQLPHLCGSPRRESEMFTTSSATLTLTTSTRGKWCLLTLCTPSIGVGLNGPERGVR
jgi:hypothetical protein